MRWACWLDGSRAWPARSRRARPACAHRSASCASRSITRVRRGRSPRSPSRTSSATSAAGRQTCGGSSATAIPTDAVRSIPHVPLEARLVCSNCGQENRAGRKFCPECAAPRALPCPSCGALNEPGEKFCGECAQPLPASVPTTASLGQRAAVPVAERRLVSVLFADLVGFTTLAEGRDAEDTRELLTSYFDLSRDVIGRYGGTVEKFIGDAVMAVWGAPTAHEDDAERAVRAALELVDAVRSLGPAIQARA